MNFSSARVIALATVAVLVVSNCLPKTLKAEELEIGIALDSPPYVMDDASSGIEIDILRKALALRGHQFRPRQLSYKQLDEAVTDKGLDAAATVMEKKDGTYYSDQYITFHNFAFTRRNDKIKIDSIKDLKGHSIVAWENAHKDLGKQFEGLFSPSAKPVGYREIADQAMQVELFWKDKAEVAVIDEAIMTWFTKHQDKSVDTSAKLVKHKIFPPNTNFRISFKSKQIRDDFNAGLKQLKSSGEYQKIYDGYLK